MEKKRYATCRNEFYSLPQHPNQTYCSTSDCKRKRGSRWQQRNMGRWRQYLQQSHGITENPAVGSAMVQKMPDLTGDVKKDA